MVSEPKSGMLTDIWIVRSLARHRQQAKSGETRALRGKFIHVRDGNQLGLGRTGQFHERTKKYSIFFLEPAALARYRSS